jgi:hypothetical protein
MKEVERCRLEDARRTRFSFFQHALIESSSRNAGLARGHCLASARPPSFSLSPARPPIFSLSLPPHSLPSVISFANRCNALRRPHDAHRRAHP